MVEKAKLKESKDEKERRALFHAIRGRLEEMRYCLKLQYSDRKINELDEDITHGLNKGLYDIDGIFFDLLMDETPAKEILENSPKRLGTRILPVRWGG